LGGTAQIQSFTVASMKVA